jgi:hypothetical protein
VRRLDEQTRRLERYAAGPSFSEFVEAERHRSHEYGGRSVFGWEVPSSPTQRSVNSPGQFTKQR